MLGAEFVRGRDVPESARTDRIDRQNLGTVHQHNWRV